MRHAKPFRPTIRVRLTLVYGGLFMVAGAALLGATYLLTSRQLFTEPVPPDHFPSATARPSSEPGPTRESPKPLPEGGLPPVVQQARQSALRELLSQGGIALGLVGITAIGAGWVVAGRMLQPLQRITSTAATIANAPDADRRLGERIAHIGPHDEVKDLADMFDRMLDQLDRSLDGQRRFIANASHELRTPIALNRTLVEVALDEDEVSPRMRQLGTTLLAINTRHARLVEGLLLLASSERDLLKRAYVDLADIVEHTSATFTDGPVQIATELEEAPTMGNAVLLERLIQNLIDNGVKHNLPVGGWVSVTTGTHAGAAVLTVTNSGPVVHVHEIPDLFQPFHRLEHDQLTSADGVGLGLSIVQAVTRAHGGDIRAQTRHEGGLVVTVTLPEAV